MKPLNKKLGYYSVGDIELASKVHALVLGTQKNIHPEWHFNDHVWNSLDWTNPPEIDISELYRIRARQIREQFDYVIVAYSGGADSQTIVDAFLESNSHIDEIYTIWNRRRTPKVILSQTCTDPRNSEAEFDLTAKPGLERIRNASPLTKITYYDVSDDIVDKFRKIDGREWVMTVGDHLNPQIMSRHNNTREKHQLELLDRGKKTAVVYGADKPRVCVKDDGKYYAYFVDAVANSFLETRNDISYSNLEHVLFYWTPDLPEIVVKQAHLIKQWFNSNLRYKSLIEWPAGNWNNRAVYETIIKGIIYPDWDLSAFQVRKTTSPIFNEWDYWFYGYPDHDRRAYDNWLEGVKFVQANVDSKWFKYDFDGRFDAFEGMINGHFCLD